MDASEFKEFIFRLASSSSASRDEFDRKREQLRKKDFVPYWRRRALLKELLGGQRPPTGRLFFVPVSGPRWHESWEGRKWCDEGFLP